MANNRMEGFLLVDKHVGPTSHDIVDMVRRLTGETRVGHAGTLDPFASGLLIVGVGRVATREFQKLVGLDKEYEAVFVLGASSDTDDRTGVIKVVEGFKGVEATELDRTIQTFVGEIEQMPPQYSAIKVAGRKAYEAARAGESIELTPRSVQVKEFVILNEVKDLTGDSSSPTAPQNDTQQRFRVRIRCSSGTYIRALARDLGAALGTGGYVDELRRTAIGPFHVKDAVLLENHTPSTVSERLLTVESTLARLKS